MSKFDGKVALITGGTTGIGREAARVFRDEGASVIVTGNNPQDIEPARQSLGPQIEVIRSDTSEVAQIDVLMGRLGTVAETAAAALFLASADSAFMTAAEIKIGSAGRSCANTMRSLSCAEFFALRA